METEQYFYEAFDNMDRLGPGSTVSSYINTGISKK